MKTENSQYANDYNSFTRAALKWFAEQNSQKENLLLSPLSIMLLLAIAAESTCGATKNEIAKALSRNLDFEQAMDLLCAIQTELLQSKMVSVGNAVAVSPKTGKLILPEYQDKLKTRFDGEIFSAENLSAAISQWVKEKTFGLIDGLDVPKIQDTVACLLNAIAFKAEWQIAFEESKIKDKVFRNADGTIITIPMLHGKEAYYLEDNEFTGFIKPYKEDTFSFMALLPKKEGNTALQKALENLDLTALYNRRHAYPVSVAMPEFKYECDSDVTQLCMELGIKTIFTDAADFSAMSDQKLKAGGIKQKAKIVLDRKGTKAAAVTYMPLATVSCSVLSLKEKEVILDRPFIYAIVHNQTGLPIFTGIFNMIG